MSPPTTSTQDLIADDGGLPIGSAAAASAWSTRSASSPAPAATSSPGCSTAPASRCLIALSATTITVVLGVSVGIIAGYSRGWLDAALGRLMDLILAFPLILILLALSPVLTQRLQTTFHLGEQRRPRSST